MLDFSAFAVCPGKKGALRNDRTPTPAPVCATSTIFEAYSVERSYQSPNGTNMIYFTL